MKPTYLVLVFLLLLNRAALCAAQDAPKSENSDANPSAQAPAPSPGQTPEQASPPANPSPSQPADQIQSPAKDSQSSKDAKKDEPGASAGASAGTSKDRLFFALPNFLTVESAGNIPPLTAGQKFKVVARGAFDPVQIVWYAALSGICQADNCEPGFGQGWAAYGKRYGAYAADGTIENFFVGAILPSMLHQDPRFFRKTDGSFVHRAGYAVSRIVVTRSDSGQHQFNFSEIFGSAIASAVSTYSYHPHPGYHPQPGVNVPYIASDRTLKNTATVWGSQVGYDTITLVIKEFWPDVARKLKKQPH